MLYQVCVCNLDKCSVGCVDIKMALLVISTDTVWIAICVDLCLCCENKRDCSKIFAKRWHMKCSCIVVYSVNNYNAYAFVLCVLFPFYCLIYNIFCLSKYILPYTLITLELI